MTPPPIEITSALLSEWLDALSRFSAEGPGVTRLAFDEHWCQAHRWLAARAADLGLAATADAAGNLFFHDPALVPAAPGSPVILVGSHLDSVASGGRFDGAYGVLSGLLVAAELRGRGTLPVVGLATCEEEESRFHGNLLGARSLLGLASAAELDALLDSDGVSWRRALESARLRGCATALAPGASPFTATFRAAMMIEPHIEQGPVLETERLGLGVVDRVAGYRRLRAILSGEARHSGTTPMPARRDALAAAAEMILAAETLAMENGPPALATAGSVRARPGLFNVVPGACELWLEVRHVELDGLARLLSELERRCKAIAARRGVGFAIEQVSSQAPAPLSPDLAAAAERLAEEQGIAHRRMASGAAHDAMVFARAGVPSLLVFVPSRRGISHSPEEFTDAGALWTGYHFVRDLAARLAAGGGTGVLRPVGP
ncbi:MAG: hypothetical protein A2W00_10570 [Candidatus Eisenbacteria bacterium RBG_16_71_46]|nr:MAG: hypothetical protein A2W00_10570 [Candidatus Eisenbacteria bacterium RBG_16_71_46]